MDTYRVYLLDSRNTLLGILNTDGLKHLCSLAGDNVAYSVHGGEISGEMSAKDILAFLNK